TIATAPCRASRSTASSAWERCSRSCSTAAPSSPSSGSPSGRWRTPRRAGQPCPLRRAATLRTEYSPPQSRFVGDKLRRKAAGRRPRLDRTEYEKLDRSEDRMWWFAALHANLILLYRTMTKPAAAHKPTLDAGCGTGGLVAC